MREAVSKMEKINRIEFKKYYKELNINSYESFIDSNFDWACDACLSSKKAIKANPGSQNSCWEANFAYFDSEFNCNKCGIDFTFGKEEKKYWFESLKFWVGSTPNNCVNCRKEIRLLKNQNKVLSDILRKDEGEMTALELEHVVDIYNEWGKEERAKYYESLLRKKPH